MAQSNPVRRPLFVLPGWDGTGTDPVPGPEPATVPLVLGTGTGDGTGPSTEPAPVTGPVPMTVPERTRLALGHWAGTAANGAGVMWLNPGRVGHALYRGKPNSMAERRAYVKSRAWVPPELKDDLSGKLIAGEGVVFHWVAGLIQTVLLGLIAALDRQLRTAGLIAGILVLVFVVLPHIPHL